MTVMVEQEDSTRARTHLSDLVRDRRAELRLSLRAVEDRTAAPDGTPVIKKSWLDRLEKRESVIPPQVPELEALARALELPVGRLQDAAAAQFFGIDVAWSSSGEARAMVAHMDHMTPEQREQLARLVEAFASQRRPE